MAADHVVDCGMGSAHCTALQVKVVYGNCTFKRVLQVYSGQCTGLVLYSTLGQHILDLTGRSINTFHKQIAYSTR